MICTVSDIDLARIVFGDHDDPFSVLGYHELENNGKTIKSVRALIPDAQNVSVVIQDREPVPMIRCHPGGFFEAHLETPLQTRPYQLDISYDGNDYFRVFEPYSFDTIMTSFDLHLIGEGTEEYIYHKLGAHPRKINGIQGVYFAVWAPNARRVSVTGPFNRWNGRQHPMRRLKPSGVWEIFMPGIGPSEKYKFEVVFQSRHILMKADPFAFAFELRPRCASIVTDLDSYDWHDQTWLENRKNINHFEQPMSIYEVHLGSWRQKDQGDDGNPFYNYRDLARMLVDYVKDLGYTHIELMPVLEHLLDKSWGYQVTGYYAPTSRYGKPDDFKFFVDYCHQNNIGVIMDWVPAHFPRDYTALARFDGTALFEHLDPKKGFHPHWGTYIFNFGRNEVRNFLIGSALFWLKEYHLDGLRVDAVASMLYLDYGRENGQWVPNKYGGRENLEAIDFLKELNIRIHDLFPDVLVIAEESTAWPLVSKPVYLGGLGFDMKWNMGWMHDTLKYMQADPIFRKYQHNTLTWNLSYAFSENYILPFSHDEVVHLKHSMLDKMPGDVWKKMANLRLCYAYQYSHPGKKLLFMGSEFGQWWEWTETSGLDWELLQYPAHRQLQQFVRELNHFYRQQPALWEVDFKNEGYEWIDFADAEQSIISFIRRGKGKKDELIWVFNFTPVPRFNYRIGFPQKGKYHEIFNTDLAKYGGSNVRNPEIVRTESVTWQGFDNSCSLTLPPLAAIVLKR